MPSVWNPLDCPIVPSSIYQELANAINRHELGINTFENEIQMHRTLVKRIFQEAGDPLKPTRGCAALEIW
jgi:hypothetical protein